MTFMAKYGVKFISMVSALAGTMFFFSCTGSFDMYCRQYAVYYTADITKEPYNYIQSPHQYITVRRNSRNGTVETTKPDGSVQTDYQYGSDQYKNFMFGLGGLIIGTPALDQGNIWCFDLACPICNSAAARLDIDNVNGKCTCPKCKSAFDLDNSGFVLETSSDDPRPLFRYPVTLSGTNLIIRN